jgi:transposase
LISAQSRGQCVLARSEAPKAPCIVGRAIDVRSSTACSHQAQAVRLVLDEGQNIPRVARDLDLTESNLRVWVDRARADRTGGKTGLTTAKREELTPSRRGSSDGHFERTMERRTRQR